MNWLLARFIPAIIMAQTLFFKFTGSPESKWIFSQLGVEPWGRYLTAVLELAAVVLLVFPRTTVFGALLAVLIMGGAVLSHIFVLGISVQGDRGLLFTLGLITLIISAAFVWQDREKLFFWRK